MLGVKLMGEVEYLEKGTEPAPERILAAQQAAPVPTIKLRVRDSAGAQVQVLYRGDVPGHLDVGDQVRIRGVRSAGLFRADSIYNETTASWVTERECFVATAAAGSSSPEVATLRLFRDEWLLKTFAGPLFVEVYERGSPGIAAILVRSRYLRAATLWGLVRPAAWLVARATGTKDGRRKPERS